MNAEVSPGRALLQEVLDVPEMAMEIAADADLLLAGINSGDLIRLGLKIEERSDRALSDEDLVELQTVDGIERVLKARSL